MFEKVTLGEEERKEKKVVKIGFLNVATNHWIVVNDQGVVTLQVNIYIFWTLSFFVTSGHHSLCFGKRDK